MATFGVQPPPPPAPPRGSESAQTAPESDPKAVRENPLGTSPPPAPPSNPFEAPQRDELPDLERVPFPLAEGADGKDSAAPEPPAGETKREVPPPPRAGLKFADLRDPFSVEAHGDFRARPGAGHTVAMMPDLRDPFLVRERPRSKALRQVHLPGDIRDPFAPELTATRQRPANRCFPPSQTRDGLQVQRPTGWTPPEGCPQPENDLRDPFHRK